MSPSESGGKCMRISEAKKCIKELYLNTNNVSALVSERGVGKTSAYNQCANELNIGYIGLYAAALEGPDFMGLPDKDREKGITRYLAPQFLPTVQAINDGIYPPKGLLVLEEINRVPSDTTSVLYPLLLERKINGHSLAPGWKIGVTMNPDTMNYSVNSSDDAMLDRFIAIEVTADLNDYIDYSIENSPNDAVLEYLQACPDMLLIVKKTADATALSKSPTPRGWTKVQELLNNCDLHEKLMYELIMGILGPETASSFFGFMKDRSLKIPSTDTLLNDYDQVKPIVIEILNKNRLDILNLVLRKLVIDLQLSDVHMKNLNAFLDALPEELTILFYKLLATKRADDFEEITRNIDSFDKVSDRIIEIMMV
jgi:hypothetical protein